MERHILERQCLPNGLRSVTFGASERHRVAQLPWWGYPAWVVNSNGDSTGPGSALAGELGSSGVPDG